jgi:kynurenine formamidase
LPESQKRRGAHCCRSLPHCSLLLQGYYYAANKFEAYEHGGTHMDAPAHFAQGGHAAHEVPLQRLMGRAVVCDVSAPCKNSRDHLISVADLERCGPIPDDSIVFLRTGFGAFYPDRAMYLGTAQIGNEAIPSLSFPGLDASAAKWLLERRVKAVGIDTASIDRGKSTMFESHQVLLGAGVPVFENVANLHLLPPSGMIVIALPMKIKGAWRRGDLLPHRYFFAGGTGAPLRMVALSREAFDAL